MRSFPVTITGANFNVFRASSMPKRANLEKMELFALGKSQGKTSAALAKE